MIAYLQTKIAGVASPEEQRSMVREYMQMRVLQSMQDAGAMITLAFHGGTALRILYDLPRYSEVLDFALERQREQYDFRKYLARIQSDLIADTYIVDLRINERNVVHSAFVRLRGLFHQLGLSPHQSEVLAIKIEIDTNPPALAQLATSWIDRHVVVHLQHHDPASLLAGQLHALLQREYVKGRDWFDLYWYLRQSNWPQPNLKMLNQALQQSGWIHGELTGDNWTSHVQARLDSLSWPQVSADVERFLLAPADMINFQKETLAQLLAART